MLDYTIKAPVKKYQSHPKIEALKGVKIGPIFPEDPNRVLGMRGQKRPGTKNADWMTYRENRRVRSKIASRSRSINARKKR